MIYVTTRTGKAPITSSEILFGPSWANCAFGHAFLQRKISLDTVKYFYTELL